MAFQFCDQIILMKNGEILAFGKTEEVLSSGNILEAFEVEVTIKEVEDEKGFFINKIVLLKKDLC